MSARRENIKGQEITDNPPVNPDFLCTEGSVTWIILSPAQIYLQDSCKGLGHPWRSCGQGGRTGKIWKDLETKGALTVGKNCSNNKLFALKERKVFNTIKGGPGLKGKHMSETDGASLFERKICLLLILYNISHRDKANRAATFLAKGVLSQT